MKKIILKELHLVNFKGEHDRITRFNPDVTTISGANGLGKSRHFDAFIWLLFGKDAQDRKDYEIKTRQSNGEQVHNIESTVTGIIDVDGTEIKLTRSLVEDWRKPRGKNERVLKGTNTQCWWNDTPVKVSEYDKRVAEIVDSTVFKMITNPFFFVNMDWRLQREQLFLLAGNVTYAEIAGDNPDFLALLDKISGKSLADFKIEIAARKKKLQAKLDEINPRIDQTEKMKPEPEDFAALDAQVASLDAQLAEIDNAIASASEAQRMKYDAERAKEKRISDIKTAGMNRVNELETKCRDIIFKAREASQDKAFKENAARRELNRKIEEAQSKIDDKREESQHNQVRVANIHLLIDKKKERQDELRKRYVDVYRREYNGETVCPHCGQPLPENMIAKAREVFNKHKADECAGITKDGQELGKEIKELEDSTNPLNDKINSLRSEIEELNTQLGALKTQLSAMPEEAKPEEVIPEDIPEWVNLQKQIAEVKTKTDADAAEVEKTINKDVEQSDETKDLIAKKTTINNARTDAVNRLAKRELIANCDKAIEQLNKDGKKLSEKISEIERIQYTCEQFTRARIEECEKRINGKFDHIKFRLFDYTLDGNPVETCVPLCDGVPFPAANKASQVNAGLDIINALCEYNGVCAPIFIDNRESVNDIIKTKSQIINLVVTKDTTLKIQ